MSQGMSHPRGSSCNGCMESKAEFELGTTLIPELALSSNTLIYTILSLSSPKFFLAKNE